MRPHRLVRLALSVGGLATTARPAPAQAASAPLAIAHTTVIDVATGARLRDQTVVVQGNRITAVGPSTSVAAPRGARVVDGRGHFVIPGLWDMHAHAAGYGDTTGRPALLASLANGVTGLRDMGAPSFATAKRWRDAIAAGRMLGPRLLIASPIVEHPRWLATVIGWEEKDGRNTDNLRARFGPKTADEATRFVDSVVAMGANHIKVRNWPAPDVSKALVARARERGIPVVGHANVPFPDDDVASYEHGIFPRLELGDAARDTLFRRWAANGVAFVPTLVASVTRQNPTDSLLAWIDAARNPRLQYVPSDLLEEWRGEVKSIAKNESPFDWARYHRERRRDLRDMKAAGVRILAASDFGAPLTQAGFGLQEELGLLVREVGMTPLEALQAATIRPAEFLGLADSLGVVAQGKLADLVLLDADPLADIRNTRRIRAVVANGRLLDRAALDRLLRDASTAAQARH